MHNTFDIISMLIDLCASCKGISLTQYQFLGLKISNVKHDSWDFADTRIPFSNGEILIPQVP